MQKNTVYLWEKADNKVMKYEKEQKDNNLCSNYYSVYYNIYRQRAQLVHP